MRVKHDLNNYKTVILLKWRLSVFYFPKEYSDDEVFSLKDMCCWPSVFSVRKLVDIPFYQIHFLPTNLVSVLVDLEYSRSKRLRSRETDVYFCTIGNLVTSQIHVVVSDAGAQRRPPQSRGTMPTGTCLCLCKVPICLCVVTTLM